MIWLFSYLAFGTVLVLQAHLLFVFRSFLVGISLVIISSHLTGRCEVALLRYFKGRLWHAFIYISYYLSRSNSNNIASAMPWIDQQVEPHVKIIVGMFICCFDYFWCSFREMCCVVRFSLFFKVLKKTVL